MEVKIEKTWQAKLSTEFEQDYFKSLREFVRSEYLTQIIYPRPENLFKAFELCPFNEMKLVILGQDPYHGPKQSHGLAFSVEAGVSIPPSLLNIFKELKNDLNIIRDSGGDLSSWAKQGVLLLNATLTVRAGQAGSHQGHGWETFTDKVIQILSQQKNNLVFILWGAYAQSKAELIDSSKHLIIKSVHPSPLSAYRGFFGSKPFSRANNYLKANKITEIDWSK
ncbi:MAG: uracil-DNA glycosylase [Patescibacteria group bacterium]|nr:uracil-DNA glycosylase [Patescibacteria group bacterium]